MKHTVDIVDIIVGIPIVIFWLAGIVLAKGFWLTSLAICVPPYAWYLVVERGMKVLGWIYT